MFIFSPIFRQHDHYHLHGYISIISLCLVLYPNPGESKQTNASKHPLQTYHLGGAPQLAAALHPTIALKMVAAWKSFIFIPVQNCSSGYCFYDRVTSSLTQLTVLIVSEMKFAEQTLYCEESLVTPILIHSSSNPLIG